MDYPDTLPLYDDTSYSLLVDDGIQRTAVPTAEANQYQSFNSSTITISMQFSMQNAIYVSWYSWAITSGYDWFNMPLINSRAPQDITSTRRIRFITPITYQKNADNWLTVSVSAEMIPGDIFR